MSTKIKLKDLALFQGFSVKELNSIKPYLQEKEYKKGEIIFLEGNSCERILIVQSGRVKIFRTASSGREQILEILEPGNTCACNPGSLTWCCSTSAQAVTPCKVWMLPRNKYVELVQTNLHLARTLNKLFAQKLCRFSSLIEEVSLNDARKRLVKFLLDMNDNGVAKNDGKGVIFVPFTREEIAQRLGTTRETVARHLHHLKRSKFIEIKPRQITIQDREGLEELLLK